MAGRLGLEAYVRVYAPEAERNRSVLRTHLAHHPALPLVAEMDPLTLHHAMCLLKTDKAAFLACVSSTTDAGSAHAHSDPASVG